MIFITWIAFIPLQQKTFRNLIMPSENTTILEFNQYQTCDKAPFIIYAGLEV